MSPTSTALTAIPEAIHSYLAYEGLSLVAAEPPKANGVFSLYFAAPGKVLHISFQEFTFKRCSWVRLSPQDISAIAFSFQLRAGKPYALARLEASRLMQAAGVPFAFASVH